MSVDYLLFMNQVAGWISSLTYFFVAFLCGCVTATAELFSRYSDSPGSTFRIKESYAYLALNGVFSLIAYAMIKESGISFGLLGNSPISQAVLAGFSAMAILRSSVASIKRGQTTLEIGLAPVLQTFLDKVDRAFDQNRSQGALKEVGKIMKDVEFIKAAKDLPTTCINLMQNVSKEEQERMGRDVLDLTKSELNPQTKTLNLGFIISRVTGPALLRSAVESLGDVIRTSSQQHGVSREQSALTYEEERIRELKKKFLWI